MDDTLLFAIGSSAFGLMMVGIIFTVVEFRAIAAKDRKRKIEESNSSTLEQG